MMRFTTLSGIFGVFCTLLILSALEFTPSESSPHRMVRQIPGVDQAISAMKTAGESFVKTGTDIMSKVPEAAGDFMNKAKEMGGQFMNPSGRRRRSSSHKSNQNKGKGAGRGAGRRFSML